jgi:hypothetical protein
VRFGASETNCRSCQQLYPASDLDRYLWCPQCLRTVRKRGAMWGRIVGLVASVGVATYVWLNLTLQSQFLVFYLLLLAMTYLLTSRIVHAVVHGYYRSRGGMIEPSPQEPE